MKHALVYIIFCLISFASVFAQTGSNQTDEEGQKQGSWVGKYQSGEKRYTGQFKDDQPVGKFTYYTIDGDIETILNYGENSQTAKAIFLHPNGKLKATGRYVNQKKDSTWLFYDELENLTMKENYKNDTKHGESISYFDDGKIAETKFYQSGSPSGENKQFYGNGQVKMIRNFDQGKANGSVTYYYDTGQKQYEGTYSNGIKQGKWVFYHPDGSLHYQALYNNGVVTKKKYENGTFKEEYASGIPKLQINYRNGDKHGEFVEFHEVGEWVTEKQKLMEEAPAQEVKTLKGIQVKRKGEYKNNELHGEIKYFDQSGNLEKVEEYEEGKLINTENK